MRILLARRRLLGHLEPKMALFHHARCGYEACIPSDKDRLRVAVAQRFQFAQPSCKHRRDAVQRKLSMNAQKTFGLSAGKTLFSTKAQASLQFWDCRCRQCKSHRKSVASKSRKKIGAGLNRIEQLKSVDGSARAVRHTILDADHNCGLGGALYHPRGENANNASMPSIAIDHQQSRSEQFWIGCQPRFNRTECESFSVAALTIEPLQLGGQFLCAAVVARAKELDDVRGDIHSSCRVDSGCEPECNVEAGQWLRCHIQCSNAKERLQTRANRPAQLAKAQCRNHTIFALQRNGIGNGG